MGMREEPTQALANESKEDKGRLLQLGALVHEFKCHHTRHDATIFSTSSALHGVLLQAGKGIG